MVWSKRDEPGSAPVLMPDDAAESGSPAPQPKEYITLVSAEGHEFQVEKQAAMVSNTIKNMLTGEGKPPSALRNPPVCISRRQLCERCVHLGLICVVVHPCPRCSRRPVR
eukprot:SAG31_NODE_60_length_29419_cov_39.876398_15_plen_110_part_00